MKKKLYLFVSALPLLFVFLLFLPQLEAQLSFTDRSDLLPPGDYHSGISVGIADMNKDGFDDIVRLSDGRMLIMEYQKADGTGFETLETGIFSSGSQWTLSIGDIDNNGFNDVMTGGLNDGIKVTMADDLGEVFTNGFLPGSSFFAQGSNFADMNNDGWLDAFVCNDDGESRIWSNDGAGNLSEADHWIDMVTMPSSDNSGNYGSVWTDFDNDGDLDLYIAKCRQFVDDESDPRRINALFVNDGNGNYTEKAQQFGLNIGAQTWTAEFQDIDNDGDLDCFITNHDRKSQVLENDGNGYFTDLGANSGMENMFNPLQGLLRDFDNDGFVDIIIAGDVFYYYHNNGDKTFTLETEDLFGSQEMHSYGIGDLNHDGFLDVYATYAEGFTTPSNKDDLLWLNDGNDNNFLAINLTGEISNRNGVGARIETYGAWGIQVREVRAGESYGIHNTFTQHFGLGTHTAIDSIIVKWPSGIKDKIESVSINQFVNIEEGGCVSPNSNLSLVGETTFCTGDSLVIIASQGYNYTWSNGADTPAIVVKTGGTYNVTVSDDNGCEGVSQTINVVVDPVIVPEISLSGDSVFCPDNSVYLTTIESDQYLWSTGDTTQTIEVFDAGIYWVEIAGLCGDSRSEEVTVSTYAVPPPATTDDTVINSGSGVLKAQGEELTWFEEEFGGNPIDYGSEFTTPNLNITTTYWVEDNITFKGLPEFGGKADTSAMGSFMDNGFLGLTTAFSEPVILKSIKVFADIEGERLIRFYDSDNNDNLGVVTVMIPKGESRIIFDKELPASEEIFIFINNNARLFHDEDLSKINFPYPIGEFGEIISSSDGKYYYFYDWEVEPIDKLKCISQRAPAVLFVDTDTKVEEGANIQTVNIFPNPVLNDLLHLQADLLEPANLKITDLQGKTLLQSQLFSKTPKKIEMTDWARGIYLVKITSGENVYIKKVVLQ